MRFLAVLAFGPLLFLAACSSDKAAPNASPVSSVAASDVSLPSEILGLKVVRENVKANLADVSETYLSSVGLFSFREKSNLLRATIEVGRFNEQAKQDQKKFRGQIIGQLGASVPVELRVGSKPVYLATGSDQNIFAWFDSKAFYVLSIRSDYQFPRTLLRKLVDSRLS